MGYLLAAAFLLVCGLGAFLVAPVFLVLPLARVGRTEEALGRLRWLRWCLGADVLEGALLFDADRLAEAEAHLRRTEARTGTGSATRAFVHVGQRRADEAVAAATVAAGPDPAASPFRGVLALAQLAAGRATLQTRTWLDTLVDEKLREGESWVAPGDLAEALALRSWVHASLGFAELSAEDARRALDHLPHGTLAADEVQWLLARAAYARGDAEAGHAALLRAVGAHPASVWARLALEDLSAALDPATPSRADVGKATAPAGPG